MLDNQKLMLDVLIENHSNSLEVGTFSSCFFAHITIGNNLQDDDYLGFVPFMKNMTFFENDFHENDNTFQIRLKAENELQKHFLLFGI